MKRIEGPCDEFMGTVRNRPSSYVKQAKPAVFDQQLLGKNELDNAIHDQDAGFVRKTGLFVWISS